MIGNEIWSQKHYPLKITKWAILILSLILSAIIWSFTTKYYENQDQLRFSRTVHSTANNITKYISKYELALHASVGMIVASDTVTREEWYHFVQELNLNKSYPGLQGIGFSIMLNPGDLRNFEKKIRSDNFPSFSIFPSGVREQYSSVLYLEPMTANNQKTIGYDMFSHPVYRSAMEKARDTGDVSTSEKVFFTQNSTSAGIVMYHPVYQTGKTTNTVQERRNALIGFAYSPIQMNAMMSKIPNDNLYVNLEIYDDSEMSHDHLLYRSQNVSDNSPKYHRVEKLNINGTIWYVKFTSTAKFDKEVSHTYPLLATAAGLLIYFILVYIIIRISETKHFIENKNNQLAFLNTMIDASNDMMFIIRISDGYIEYINKSTTAMVGYTLEEIREVGMERFRRPLTGDESFNEHLQNLKQQNKMVDYATVICKDGTSFPVEASVRIFNYNGIDYNIAMVRNITDIRRAQEQIKANEHFYRTIFSTVNEAIFVVEGKIVIDCNTRALELFKTTKTMLVGNSIENSIRKIACTSYDFDHYLSTAGNAQPVEIKASLVLYGNTKSAKILNIAIRAFAPNDPKMIVVIRDITKDVEDEKNLKMHSRQAQMNEMISIIAHQWRQPLTVINSISAHTKIQELLKADSNEVLIENMTKIEKQILHLSETITDFKDFFIPNKAKETLNFTQIIISALSLMDHLIKSNEIEIQEVTVNNPEFFSYRNEIIHVLMTILKNAFEAFEANKTRDAKIIITLDQDTQYAILTIQDNAGGICPAIIDKVFIPYFTTKHDQGTGLGLYMSKMIIEDNCDGTLEVSSQDDYTTFTIKIPLKNEIE
ncbi:MAG: CHASE domain-containing protein [Sulfuricurvum sp.]|nr:CHASE domain-containing protein [Sulfuricurvum sp.]